MTAACPSCGQYATPAHARGVCPDAARLAMSGTGVLGCLSCTHLDGQAHCALDTTCPYQGEAHPYQWDPHPGPCAGAPACTLPVHHHHTHTDGTYVPLPHQHYRRGTMRDIGEQA